MWAAIGEIAMLAWEIAKYFLTRPKEMQQHVAKVRSNLKQKGENARI